MERSEDMDKDLKPCPFCGGEANFCYLVSKDNPMEYGVSCASCSASKRWYSSSQTALEVWNTRATDCLAVDVDDCIKANPADNYDDLKKQFCALKTVVNCKSKELSFYKDKDYKLSEDRLRELEASIESEREMNAQLTKELDDHLASRNVFRGAVEPIEGLDKALESYINKEPFERNFNIVFLAATKYKAMTKGG